MNKISKKTAAYAIGLGVYKQAAVGDLWKALVFGGPPVLGLAAGMGAAKATQPEKEDIDNLQKQILLDEYNALIGHLRRRRAIEHLA